MRLCANPLSRTPLLEQPKWERGKAAAGVRWVVLHFGHLKKQRPLRPLRTETIFTHLVDKVCCASAVWTRGVS